MNFMNVGLVAVPAAVAAGSVGSVQHRHTEWTHPAAPAAGTAKQPLASYTAFDSSPGTLPVQSPSRDDAASPAQ